jgi:hypothetical protein
LQFYYPYTYTCNFNIGVDNNKYNPGGLMQTVFLVIDNQSLEEYNKYYFTKYPKRKVPPIKNPIPPSLNQWMVMKRPQMNNEKQKWKEFIMWLVNKYNLQNQQIDNATITFTYYFKTRIRHDADNYTPKNIWMDLQKAVYY